METLSKLQRVDRVREHMGDTTKLTDAARIFDIPYGTLRSSFKRNVLDGYRNEGTDFLNINDRFQAYCKKYSPMTKEQRRRMGQAVKKAYAIKKNSVPSKAPANEVPATILEKLTMVQAILKEVEADIKKLNKFKDRIESALVA